METFWYWLSRVSWKTAVKRLSWGLFVNHQRLWANVEVAKVLQTQLLTWQSAFNHFKPTQMISFSHSGIPQLSIRRAYWRSEINTISYSLNKGSLNDAKKKIRSTRPLSASFQYRTLSTVVKMESSNSPTNDVRLFHSLNYYDCDVQAPAFWCKFSRLKRLFRLDALALSVIATATWLAGWLGGCYTPVLYQNR